MAQGVLTALRRAGRVVPDDVAVGGFDDSAAATTSGPGPAGPAGIAGGPGRWNRRRAVGPPTAADRSGFEKPGKGVPA